MNKEIEDKINGTIKSIFSNVDISSLSQYEKRQKIFSYLCDSLKYDFELLNKIHDNEVNKTKFKRNLVVELNNTILNGIGICSSISQYYKLLLEQVDIKSYCVVCDDGTPVNHQLTLVYDIGNDSYSFDDVTSVIVGRGEKKDFFDYDIVQAKSKGQGNKEIMDSEQFVILPEDYVDFLVGRDKSFSETLTRIPYNVFSVKGSNNLIREI